jgi:hypothetical protein
MLYIILGILLLIIIIQFLPQRREGYTSYNETSCQTLAKQNQDNITSLQADVKKLAEMESKVVACEGKLEANSQQLKLITDQVYKSS